MIDHEIICEIKVIPGDQMRPEERTGHFVSRIARISAIHSLLCPSLTVKEPRDYFYVLDNHLWIAWDPRHAPKEKMELRDMAHNYCDAYYDCSEIS